MLRNPAILLLVTLAGHPLETEPDSVAGAERTTYAALPLRDLSGEQDAALRLARTLQRGLEARGAAFVSADDLEVVLAERRIRYTDSLSLDDARAIGAGTGADFLLAGAVLQYQPGSDPHVSVALRAIGLRDGERVQSDLVSLRGRDFRGLLGLGAIEDVVDLELEVVARLLEGFDDLGRPQPRSWSARALRRDRPSDALVAFVDEDFDPAELERLAVMPLVNGTSLPFAGVQFSEILSHAWFRSGGVQVVETSELRAALVRARVRSIEFLDRSIYAQLARDLRVRHFVLGRLDVYAAGTNVTDEGFPSVEASIRLLDAKTGRIVAAAAVLRSGDDYHVLLGRGVVRDLIQLADRVARELVALILE